MPVNWWKSRWNRFLLAGVVVLLVIAIISILHDPFDFDDRPHIQSLLKLALSNVQSHVAVEMQEGMLEQVRFAAEKNLPDTSEHEWKQTSNFFLAHSPGYVGLLAIDARYRTRRIVELPEAGGVLSAMDFSNSPDLRHLLETAANSNDRVATARRILQNGRLGYLIAVPNIVGEEVVGFLVALSDIEKTLDSILSEFKGLEFSLAVRDGSTQLYSTGEAQHREQWGQIANVPLTAVDWQVEVWPKPEMLANTRSPFLELVAIFTTLLVLLLASTIHFGRVAQAKSFALQTARDELEHKVDERTTELQHTNEALRNLSRHVLHVQDEERRRIARELHDSTAQALSGLKINLSTLLKHKNFDPSVSTTLLEQSRTMAEHALNEIRTISYLLHPPILEDFGLESALTWYATGFGERSGIQINVKIDPDLGRFSSDLELIVFRVVQEALGNIHRHSGSSTAEVSLSRDSNNIRLLVRDEGCGFPDRLVDPKRGVLPPVGVGIAGMRERIRQFGGTLEIASSSSGSLLTVVLPIADQPQAVDLEAQESKDV